MRNVNINLTTAIILICTLLFSSHVFAENLFGISATVTSKDSAGYVYYKIDSFYINKGNFGVEYVDTIVSACPVKEMNYYSTTIKAGDSIKLIWKQIKPPTGGYLFKGGSPEHAELIVPDYGWSVLCQCTEQNVSKEARFKLKIIDEYNECCTKLIMKGEKRGFLANRIPFKKGKTAIPPEKIRLAVEWDLNYQSSTKLQVEK